MLQKKNFSNNLNTVLTSTSTLAPLDAQRETAVTNDSSKYAQEAVLEEKHR